MTRLRLPQLNSLFLTSLHRRKSITIIIATIIITIAIIIAVIILIIIIIFHKSIALFPSISHLLQILQLEYLLPQSYRTPSFHLRYL